MYRLISNKTELVLLPDYAPDVSLNLTDLEKQSGSRIFPFSLPACPVNDAFFGFPALPQSNMKRNKKYTASLYDGSILLAKGILVLKTSSQKGYTVELLMPPALIEMETWQKNIRTLDFGSLQMPTITTTAPMWQLNVSNLHATMLEPNTRTGVHVNGVRYGRFVTGPDARWNYERDANEEIQEQFQTLLDDFNTEQTLNAGFELVIQNDTFAVLTPSGNHTILLRIEKIVNATIPYKDYPFSQLQYQSIGNHTNTFASNTASNAMFCLPTIYTPKLYAATENKNWNGYLNLFENGNFETNPINTPSKYALSPCLFFIKTLSKLCEVLGYEATGEVIEDVSLQNLYFLTSVTIDAQSKETKIKFNVWQTFINYADHLPDFSVKDFLQHLSTQFCFDIHFNALTKTANFFYIKTALSRPPKQDLSQRIKLETIEIEHTEHDKIQVAFANLSEDEEKKLLYASVPTDAQKNINEKYKTINYLFLPPTLFQGGLRNATILHPSHQRAGVSKMHNAEKNTPTLYLAYYKGLVDGYLQSSYQQDGKSLAITEDGGLHQQNQAVIAYQENSYAIIANIPFSNIELANLHPWAKYHLHGVNCFLTSIQGTAGKTLKTTFTKA